MRRKDKGFTLKALACGAAYASAWVLPTAAFAQSPSGADLLLPKPAEFIPALIAFLVIWFVLAKLAWPQILSAMEKRQQKIQDDLDAAAQSKEEAQKAAKSYESKIAEANREAESIIAKAKKEAEEQRSQILAKAQREAADIITKSRGAVDSERKKAMIELSSSVVDLAVEISGKVIGNELTVEQQRKLAEKYLAEVSTPHDQQA